MLSPTQHIRMVRWRRDVEQYPKKSCEKAVRAREAPGRIGHWCTERICQVKPDSARIDALSPQSSVANPWITSRKDDVEMIRLHLYPDSEMMARGHITVQGRDRAQRFWSTEEKPSSGSTEGGLKTPVDVATVALPLPGADGCHQSEFQ